ncbi:aldehyde dehydrogenase family protein [Novosphingobium sp. Leaf2]|uniref:aldehyde dehydrogenase family protein n=1 Tax=Novosphingobium sp. Leaf2 TaxID=1735670 RepID=UPI0006FC4D91|nr:aldehyde dehydrogenase family protein [Novosphingobium sp. Leaf2]KQM20798.1 aldehyde dehydrogenase [Novosphingobium sp. Leaf2]
MANEMKALHLIGGEWLDAGEPGESFNPATGDVIGTYGLAGAVEAERAISAAGKAFKESGWKDDHRLRASVLNAMADAFEARFDELVALTGLENGKVNFHAQIEIGIAPQTLRYNAALALTEAGRAAEREPGQISLTLKQPVGIAGIIAPWNSPCALVTRSLAPALAAGCTAVVMLPYQTAQLNHLIAQIIASTKGLPPGVVNLITGGKEAGEAIVASPKVPTISFTGSTATGRAIAANAAPLVKRLGLELGGKTPLIVFDDADLDAAVGAAVAALTVFSGQFCMTGSRLLVQRGVADKVAQALGEALSAVRVGPAAEPSSEMGPLIDKASVQRVDRMVEAAIDAGARAIVRGGPVTEGALAKGAFYRPTLLEVTDNADEIIQREVFGPVLAMQVFDTEDEAVSMANDTEYGLAASVWSRDLNRQVRMARALDAGTVWINGWAALSDQFEEGGFKQSGLGRMRGLAVLEDFIEHKHISFVTS